MWKVVREIKGEIKEKIKEDEGKYYYNSQEIANKLNVDRSTIIKYIKLKFIKAKQKKKYAEYKIEHEEYIRIKEYFEKPASQWQIPYKDKENVIILKSGLKDKEIAKIIGRTVISVRVQRCRLKKEIKYGR